MELYEEAVDLALKIDHLVLAKRSANLQAAPSARKKLWLRIARRVIQRDAEPGATGTPRAGATTGRPLDEQTASRLRESVLAAATLLSECSLLRIEARACEPAGRRGVPGAARARARPARGARTAGVARLLSRFRADRRIQARRVYVARGIRPAGERRPCALF